MKRLIMVTALCIYALVSAHSQETAVFAPFVSNLEAAADDNRIVLTWNDSADPIEAYNIYRGTVPFTRDSFSEAKLIATVEPGTQALSHYPESTEAYYYCVLAVDSAGREYPLFIPFRNITSEAAAVSTVASLEDRAAVITGISARVSGEVVYLTYESSRPERPVVVYRNTSPITGPEMITSSTMVASFRSSSGSVTDFPLPGLEYYYAVIDRELVEKGFATVVPGHNSTAEPAPVTLSMAGSRDSARNVRTQPLPFLTLPRSVGTGKDLSSFDKFTLPEYKALSEKTEGAVQELIRSLPPRPEVQTPERTLFTIDNSPGEVPEALLLSSIVRGSFVEGDWKSAEKELANFLAVRRSGDIEARAHHYMGQVYYFQERYREAFYEFLFARERYRRESDAWMDTLLGLIGG